MTIKLLAQNNLYRISDLALAVTISLFYPIEALEKIDHKAYFVFKKDKKFDEFLKKYWRQELKVEPQAYFNQLKIIKARLYSE